MIDKRKTERLVGETIRDIGILVFVFGPLDALFQQPTPGVAVVALLVGGGLFFIVLGIILQASE